MRRWVQVRYGLTFQEPQDIIKYVKDLSKNEPQNRQAALALVLAWINLKLGGAMNRYAKDESATETSVNELENIIIYLADGWRKGILDLADKGLPTETELPAPAPASQPVVAQARKLKVTYHAKAKKPVVQKMSLKTSYLNMTASTTGGIQDLNN